MSEQYLQHHGVLGMKWGVRRYQNKDGSYKSGADGRYNDAVPKSQQGSGSGAKVTARAAYKNSVKRAKEQWKKDSKKYVDSNDDSFDKAADRYNDAVKKKQKQITRIAKQEQHEMLLKNTVNLMIRLLV